MAQVSLSESAAVYIDKVIETANEEKVAIADALTTAVESMQGHENEDEYLNLCSVLGRYNRLISVLS